jgi:hypothetical protein
MLWQAVLPDALSEANLALNRETVQQAEIYVTPITN